MKFDPPDFLGYNTSSRANWVGKYILKGKHMSFLNRFGLRVFFILFCLNFISLNLCFTDSEAIKGLKSGDHDVRYKFFVQIIKERTDRINELIKLLETSKMRSEEKVFNGSIHYAINALGELRAKEAIPVLIKFLEFVPDDFVVEEAVPTEAYYIATIALREIGSPAVEPLLKELLSDSFERRKNAAWCLKEILNLDIALLIISKYKERRSVEDTEKINSVETYLKKIKPTFHNPKTKKD